MDKKSITVCSVIIALTVLFTVIVAFCTDNSRNIKKKLDSGASSLSESEAVSFKSSEGNYSIKITGVYETEPDTDSENPPKADRIAVVVYEYTNADIEKGLVISDAHFKAFDKSGTALEIYPQKNMFEAGSIGASGTMTASVAFALNSPENYIEVDFFNDLSAKTPDTVYTGEW